LTAARERWFGWPVAFCSSVGRHVARCLEFLDASEIPFELHTAVQGYKYMEGVLTMPPLRIGKLAQLANVNVQTVRFYERRGLLPRPLRRPSGYREYQHEVIGLVRLIKHVQGLGFSLKEIKGLIALRKMPSATLEAASERLESKINELDAKISALAAIRSTLAQMLENHRQRGAVPFAQLFDRHVEQLAKEAVADESQLPQWKHAVVARTKRPKSANAS
jgi:MerR family copper efflux transcriptional regulator